MNKIILSALIIFSGLLLSACDLTEEAKNELLNKIEEPSPTVSQSQPLPQTDQEILNDLESTEPDLSTDFNDLETELSL